mmetsp:Transcript_18153/g.70165  ORF Transcript_18153/g.70165 Transcript_18153/m.70165 type:complete len:253 (-) Transcript_18153:3071-3829(-)
MYMTSQQRPLPQYWGLYERDGLSENFLHVVRGRPVLWGHVVQEATDLRAKVRMHRSIEESELQVIAVLLHVEGVHRERIGRNASVRLGVCGVGMEHLREAPVGHVHLWCVAVKLHQKRVAKRQYTEVSTISTGERRQGALRYTGEPMAIDHDGREGDALVTCRKDQVREVIPARKRLLANLANDGNVAGVDQDDVHGTHCTFGVENAGDQVQLKGLPPHRGEDVRVSTENAAAGGGKVGCVVLGFIEMGSSH